VKPKTRAARQGRALHNVTFYDADLQELLEEPSAEAVGVYAANAALEIKAHVSFHRAKSLVTHRPCMEIKLNLHLAVQPWTSQP